MKFSQQVNFFFVLPVAALLVHWYQQSLETTLHSGRDQIDMFTGRQT